MVTSHYLPFKLSWYLQCADRDLGPPSRPVPSESAPPKSCVPQRSLQPRPPCSPRLGSMFYHALDHLFSLFIVIVDSFVVFLLCASDSLVSCFVQASDSLIFTTLITLCLRFYGMRYYYLRQPPVAMNLKCHSIQRLRVEEQRNDTDSDTP
jgi:hypothetical protein